MPYVVRTDANGKKEYFYTSGKHKNTAARERRRELWRLLKIYDSKAHNLG